MYSSHLTNDDEFDADLFAAEAVDALAEEDAGVVFGGVFDLQPLFARLVSVPPKVDFLAVFEPFDHRLGKAVDGADQADGVADVEDTLQLFLFCMRRTCVGFGQ